MVVKSSPANARDTRDGVSSVGREGPLEEGMATHSSTLAWRIPWTEGLGGLQTRSDVTCMHVHTHTHTHTRVTRFLYNVKVAWKVAVNSDFTVLGIHILK